MHLTPRLGIIFTFTLRQQFREEPYMGVMVRCTRSFSVYFPFHSKLKKVTEIVKCNQYCLDYRCIFGINSFLNYLLLFVKDFVKCLFFRISQRWERWQSRWRCITVMRWQWLDSATILAALIHSCITTRSRRCPLSKM